MCKAVEVLDATAVSSEIPPEFGEVQLKLLCTAFGLDYSEAKNAYRGYPLTSTWPHLRCDVGLEEEV